MDLSGTVVEKVGSLAKGYLLFWQQIYLYIVNRIEDLRNNICKE